MIHYENEYDVKAIKTISFPRSFIPPQTPRKDFKCLEYIFKLGKYFGITPINFVDRPAKPSISSAIISFILLSLYIVLTYFVIDRKISILAAFNKVVAGLSYSITAAEFMFVVNSLLTLTFRRNRSWKKLLRKMFSLERKILSFNLDTTGDNCIPYFKLGLMYSWPTFIFSVRFYIYIINGEVTNIIIVASSLVTMLYIIIFNSYYVILANWMKYRLDHMDQVLVNSLTKHKMDVSAINKVAICCELVDGILIQVNKILGDIMFYNICITVLYLLFCFIYAIDDIHIGKEKQIMNFVTSSTYVVSLVVLVIACESVERSGKHLIKTCFILHESMESFMVREQLQMLIQYAEQWKPSFSAGGFFDINQSCLSSLFSATITYLVIMIQFNMVLVEDNSGKVKTRNETMKTD